MEILSTLNYIGSKKSLLNFLDLIFNKINNELNKSTENIEFGDLFSGSGIVSKYFNRKYKYKVVSNDLEYYSYIINYANLKVPYTDNLKNIIIKLNKLVDSNDDNYKLIQNNYSPLSKFERKFWTIQNSKKADAIIEQIELNNRNKYITNDEKIFLIASLIASLDKIANTTSIYGAYLKEFKKKSLLLFELKPIHNDTKIINIEKNLILNKDINSDILNNNYDIVYLDPPYNERNYGGNYGPLNYICKYDNKIEIYGKTGLLKNYNKSKFCSSLTALQEFTQIINKIKSQFIIISYNNEGLINQTDFIKILESKGKVKLYKTIYKKFKSSNSLNNHSVFEYLYVCQVGIKGDFQEEIIYNYKFNENENDIEI